MKLFSFRIWFLFFGFILSVHFSFSQIDSLIASLESNLNDTTRIKNLNTISFRLYRTSPDSSLYYSQMALEISRNSKHKFQLAQAYRYSGLAYSRLGKLDFALEYLLQALEEFESIKDTSGITRTLNSIGIVYRKQSRQDKAIEYYLRALKIKEKQGDKSSVAILYNNIGIIYNSIDNYEEAISHFQKSILIRNETKDTLWSSFPIAGLGTVYKKTNQYKKALTAFNRASFLFELKNDFDNLTRSQHNIGVIYLNLKDYDKAIEYLELAEKFYEKTDGMADLTEALIHLGRVYLEQNKLQKSSEYLLRALKLSEEIESLENEMLCFLYLSKLYSSKRNYMQALSYFKNYTSTKDSIYNKDKNKVITELQSLYDLEKAEKENMILKKDQAIQQEKIKQQNIINYSIGIGMLLVIFIAVQLFLSNRRTKKANILLAEQKKEIDDSIIYSKHIQKAVLPSQETIDAIIPNSFIFYRPKGIIGGDFYWIAEQDNKIIVAIADCTGHGVPGALMSMIGITFLNEIIINKNITDPSQILNWLRKRVIATLHQNESEDSAQEGMDIALCVIDKQTHTLQFAGANNPLIICKNGEFTELKPDKMPISYYYMLDKDFSVQEMKITKEETIYLFSDGFGDQFGGQENKKFLKNNFKQLLAEISMLPISQQTTKLEQVFDDWKSSYEQIDDVTVIGINLDFVINT